MYIILSKIIYMPVELFNYNSYRILFKYTDHVPISGNLRFFDIFSSENHHLEAHAPIKIRT